jgi:hypothetical protein
MIAVRDLLTGRTWSSSAGIHTDLIDAAMRDLGYTPRPRLGVPLWVGPGEQIIDGRFVCGYVIDAKFVTRNEI